MTIVFRAQRDFLDRVRRDLDRPHPFAAERVGFLVCSAGHLNDGGLVILAAEYDPVADEDYVNDRSVGAMMGPGAIRKAIQRAYNAGAEDLSLFHVHMHEHRGLPGFSGIDLAENRKFVPDFFNVAPTMPHGAVVLSRDLAVGLCWRTQNAKPVPIDRFASVGAPLIMWEGRKWTRD
jgi:hypothetical protein